MATGLFVAASCSQAPSPSEESPVPAPTAATATAPQPAKAAPAPTIAASAASASAAPSRAPASSTAAPASPPAAGQSARPQAAGPTFPAAAPSADRQAVATTPFFANYWGKVTLDETGAPVGAVVEAYYPSGDLVGRLTMNTAGFYGYMRVYGEDATPSAPLPGMRAGETITFKVNGKPAATVPSPAVWQNNPEPTEIDLSVG